MKIQSSRAPHVPGELLVKLKPGLDAEGLRRFAADHGARLLETIEMPASMKEQFQGDLVRLSVGPGECARVAEFSQDARVCYAEPNALVYAPVPASVPRAGGLPQQLANQPVAAQGLALRPSHREVAIKTAGAALLMAAGGMAGAWVGHLAGSWVHQLLGGVSLALPGALAGYLLGESLARREEFPDRPQPRSRPVNLDPRQWALDNQGQSWGKVDADIDAPEAWATTRGSRQAIVAVMDTGLDYLHPALAGNLWQNPEDGSFGYNAIKDNHDPMDSDSHGTHCGGIIAANGCDGVYGVSPQARLMAIKFMENKGNMADAIKGLAFATRHGARLTSHSWTSPTFSQAFKDALAASPALHILAAGNDRQNLDFEPTYPASYDLPNTLRVAATDRRNRLYHYSNFGRHHVDTAAPGHDIYSCVPEGGYRSMTGTSMAAPMVAGVANLVLAQHPDLTNAELKERLMRVTRVPSLCWTVASGGVINAARALKD